MNNSVFFSKHKDVIHTVSCSVCRKTDAFEKLLFLRQNISAAFIIHSFTCSVFISVFTFFIILCEVAKLA